MTIGSLEVSSASVVRLRPEVAVRRSEESVEIAYALWKTSIPLTSVSGSEGLNLLLCDRSIDVSRLDGSGTAVASLLEAQGCFIPRAPQQFASHDVLEYFNPVRSLLYANYYAHPLWDTIRSGAATHGQLISWMIHNYHVSRSAGPIAARMSMRADGIRVREFFREDALEEYWHCDAFYFVEAPEFSLIPREVKSYIPLPASTAFEDIALNTAENDWLGHLLLAYFQESSIIFRNESECFYDDVERLYRLPNFFTGWRRHMSLDIDEGHADGLASMFENDKPVKLNQMNAAIRRVQLAHCYLYAALTQAASQPSGAAEAVAARLPSHFQAPPNIVDEIPSKDQKILVQALREASYRVLAHARQHDDIIAAGRAAEQLTRISGDVAAESDCSLNPWTPAVCNFIVERSITLPAFAKLARLLMSWLTLDGLEDDKDIAATFGWLSALDTRSYSVEEGQLHELMTLVAEGTVLEPLKVVESAT